MEILTTAKEIRDLGDADIRLRLNEARARLREIRFRGVTERIENTAEPGQLKRFIARALTILGERQRTAAAAPKDKKAS